MKYNNTISNLGAKEPNSFFGKRANSMNALQVERLLSDENEREAMEADSWRPLHLAVSIGNKAVVQALLRRKAITDCVTRVGGYTPLMIAVHRGHMEIIKLLVEAGANFNIRTEVAPRMTRGTLAPAFSSFSFSLLLFWLE